MSLSSDFRLLDAIENGHFHGSGVLLIQVEHGGWKAPPVKIIHNLGFRQIAAIATDHLKEAACEEKEDVRSGYFNWCIQDLMLTAQQLQESSEVELDTQDTYQLENHRFTGEMVISEDSFGQGLRMDGAAERYGTTVSLRIWVLPI